MRPHDQVEYPLVDPLHARRASRDPGAMVGVSRVTVASGRFYRDRSAIITHAEGGGMEVLISDIRSSKSVTIKSNPRETRTELIARGHQEFDRKYEVEDG